MFRIRSPSLNSFQLPCTIADALGFYVHALEHGEVEIGHRGFFVEIDVPAGRERAATMTREQNWQVAMIVAVAIAYGGAINNHAVVEERALAFFHRFQLVEEI